MKLEDKTVCEVCGKPIEGDQSEYGGTVMCGECYERTVPSLDQIKSEKLDGNEQLWAGTYMLDDGGRLRCHDCWQFDEDDWDNDTEEKKVIGSIYYELDEVRPDGGYEIDCDGGEYGYTDESTFGTFAQYMFDIHQVTIIGKISDSDDPDD